MRAFFSSQNNRLFINIGYNKWHRIISDDIIKAELQRRTELVKWGVNPFKLSDKEKDSEISLAKKIAEKCRNKSNSLEAFTDNQLLAELRKRGFYGELSQQKTIKV